MTAILCDNCKIEFEGEDWMMDTTRDVLCPSCYEEKQTT